MSVCIPIVVLGENAATALVSAPVDAPAFSADTLAAIAGSALSLVFSYLPGAAQAYERLDGTRKRLVMLGLLALTSLAVFGLGCSPWAQALGLSLDCGSAGAAEMLRAFLLALVANQSTFLLSPQVARAQEAE